MVERNMIIFEPDVEYGKSTNHTSNEVCGSNIGNFHQSRINKLNELQLKSS